MITVILCSEEIDSRLFGQVCAVPSGRLQEIKRLQLISGDGPVVLSTSSPKSYQVEWCLSIVWSVEKYHPPREAAA